MTQMIFLELIVNIISIMLETNIELLTSLTLATKPTFNFVIDLDD